MLIPFIAYNRRGKMDRRRQRRFGLVVAVGIGVAAYLWWKGRDGGSSDSETRSVIRMRRQRGVSRCIVVTTSIEDLTEIDWEDLLCDDIVILVSPQVDNFKERNEITETNTQLHKIIECDTEVGLWACVRSLKKEEVIVNANDIEVPHDIPRYTSKITNIQSPERLVKYLDDV